MVFIIKLLIGLGSGLLAGYISLYLLDLDTSRKDHEILYYLFTLPVAYAFIYVIESILL